MAARQYILGLDYGNKRVGVALAHVVARLPHPHMTLQNNETLLAEVRKLVDQEAVALVVVGLPRGMDGGYTTQTRTAEAFAEELKKVLTVPVALADETLTSVDAEVQLGGHYAKGDVDAVAASLILERYLAEHPSMEAMN